MLDQLFPDNVKLLVFQLLLFSLRSGIADSDAPCPNQGSVRWYESIEPFLNCTPYLSWQALLSHATTSKGRKIVGLIVGTAG